MEQIFASIYSEIERDPPSATPKTRNGWKSRLRNTNTCRTKEEFLESKRYFENELKEIRKGINRAGLPPTWNQLKLSQLVLPEF
jgi:hypothetical protein